MSGQPQTQSALHGTGFEGRVLRAGCIREGAFLG